MKVTILWKRNVPNISHIYMQTLQTPKPLKDFMNDEWICGFKEVENGMGLVLANNDADEKKFKNYKVFLQHECDSWREYESWLEDQVWEIRVDDEIIFTQNE